MGHVEKILQVNELSLYVLSLINSMETQNHLAKFRTSMQTFELNTERRADAILFFFLNDMVGISSAQFIILPKEDNFENYIIIYHEN